MTPPKASAATPNAERLTDYPQPSVTADCVMFAVESSELQVLLVRRGVEPYKGEWAIPGGFVGVEMSLEDTARSKLREKTGIADAYLEQLYTFGDLGRDPRGRVLTVAYFSLIRKPEAAPVSTSDAASEAAWFPAAATPALAFDHAHILDMARQRLRNKIRYEPIGFELLPEKFVLTDLQRLYEGILERELDKRNFRKKILGMGILKALDEKQQNVPHRAARFYSFDQEAYERLKERGLLFEL